MASGDMMYGSQPSYPYPDYNNYTQQQQQQPDQNGYSGYSQEGYGYQQSHDRQQIYPTTDESYPQQFGSYSNNWISTGGYDQTINTVSASNWQGSQQPQEYAHDTFATSQVFTGQAVNSNIPNQSTDPCLPFDEQSLRFLLDSISQDPSIPWNQNSNITDTGHHQSNHFNSLVQPAVDHYPQLGSKSYSQTYHLQNQPTSGTPYQELGNNNNIVSSDYLVQTPGYTLSQLESSTLPDVTTTQSQRLQNVSPIIASSDPSVLEVNCFRCKFCDFISLDKSKVLSHIDTSHKSSSGQMLTNSRTDQIVSDSLVTQSSAPQGDQQRGSSQGPLVMVSRDLTTFLNESVSMSDTTSTNSSVISKKPIRLAPKVMPSILVQEKQTKPSSSMNPSNQTSITSTIIEAGLADRQPKTKSSTTNHSKGALKIVEQGKRKTKGSRKSSKSSVKKIKIEIDNFFHCEVMKCTSKFESVNNLERHKKCHTPGEEIGFKCYVCDTFTSQHWSSTAGHLWREHGVDIELHKCEHCNYRSYSLSILENQHKKIHSNEKNYVCDICDKGFKNRKQLINHKVRHLKPQVPETVVNVVPEQKFSCEFCVKSFKDKRALMVHMNGVHKKKRPYFCNNCGHRASSRGALRTHVRSHTGEKPFKCEECDYATSDHNSLRRHKMRHSGERPYKCPFCDYSCIQSSTYKQHLRNKHPGQIDGIMFTCSCGFKTVNAENYNFHIRERGATCGFRQQHGRSDGESSYSSSSSPATPALNGPESPDMHLARGILGVSSVKDLHSLKRPSSSSTSTSSEDDSSLGAIECANIAVTSAMLQSSSTSISLVNFDPNTQANCKDNVDVSDFMDCNEIRNNNPE